MQQAIGSATHRPYTASHGVTGPLLLAVDGGPCEHLVRVARVLAPAFNNYVRVVSIVEPLPAEIFEHQPMLGPRETDDPRLTARANHLAAALRAMLGPEHGWEIDVLHGDVARVLSTHARSVHAGVLLMGTSHHRTMDRVLGRETTLQVIRQAPCAVLAVGEAFDRLPRKVVVATDFSPQSALAAEAVIPLLAHGATLHFVHVWEPSGSTLPATVALEERYEVGLPPRVDRLLATLDIPPGITTTFDIHRGKTAQGILEIAEQYGADLIVAGRYGLNPLARLVVGSVTTALLRGASCALLVTPEPSLRDLDRMHRALNSVPGMNIAANWAQQLTDFANRNRGRRSVLEVDDPSLGAQMQEVGYRFADANYDPHDASVQLMFGGMHAGTPHLTHAIRDVDGIALLTDCRGKDVTLRISHGDAQTLLIFESPA